MMALSLREILVRLRGNHLAGWLAERLLVRCLSDSFENQCISFALRLMTVTSQPASQFIFGKIEIISFSPGR